MVGMSARARCERATGRCVREPGRGGTALSTYAPPLPRRSGNLSLRDSCVGGSAPIDHHCAIRLQHAAVVYAWLVVSLSAVLGVAAIAFGFVITPGPNMIYLISRTLAQGRRAGMVSLAGVACAFALYLGATTAGLAAVFAAVPALFTVVKSLGAAYLLYLAWGVLRPGGRSVFVPSGDVHPHSARRLFAMGMTTCLLNPKIALMYAALLPQFVDETASASPQLLALGLVQVSVAVTVNACWVLAAARVADMFRTRPRVQRLQRWITGSLLGGFAVHLALSPHRP